MRRDTVAGREVRIFTYAEHHRDCGQSSLPIVTILTQPAHGSVSVRKNSVVAGRSRFGAPDCSGQTYEGQGIWYLPAAGFSGPDQFDYTVDLGNGIAHDTAIINVAP
ncbi:MAG: Ig-like domain-containing protein [Rhodoferax sp.]